MNTADMKFLSLWSLHCENQRKLKTRPPSFKNAHILRPAQVPACPWFGVAICLIKQSRGFVFWEDKVVFSSGKASYIVGLGIFQEQEARAGALVSLGVQLREAESAGSGYNQNIQSGGSYLQNASLLTQPGLRDGHRSGFLNSKTMQLTKMLTFTKFYTSFQTHCVPVMPSFTTPLSDNPAHRFSGKYRVVHRVKYQFLASFVSSQLISNL